MNFTQALDDYAPSVDSWLDSAKKQVGAIAKLQKAVAAGNVRDLEKLRQSAQNAAQLCAQRAEDVAPLDFDVASHLRDGYSDELRAAAQRAGVRLYERDGVIFCYPALVRLEPDLGAVRIDKKLEAGIRPDVLAAQLKKAQSAEPQSRPDRFIETLCSAYFLALAKTRVENPIDLPLTKIYEILTLLPGAAREYTLLDFTRDLYFLDISGVVETKKGYRLSWPASTVSRERGTKILPFVTRDGHEKQYAAVKFTRA